MKYIKGALSSFLYGSKEGGRAITMNYPQDILYALYDKGGVFSSKEIETLTQEGYLEEAAYLSLKALNEQEIPQKELLGGFFHASVYGQREFLRTLLLRHVQDKNLPDVKGEKLGLISRWGRDFWLQRYGQIAEDAARDERSPVLLAYSTVFGLGEFFKIQQRYEGGPVFLILPAEKHRNHIVGYRIDREGLVVSLHKDFARPPRATLIDDVVNTGKEMRSFERFFKQGTGSRSQYEIVAVDRSHS